MYKEIGTYFLNGDYTLEEWIKNIQEMIMMFGKDAKLNILKEYNSDTDDYSKLTAIIYRNF